MAGAVDPKSQVLKARTREIPRRPWKAKAFFALLLLSLAGGAGYWYFFEAPEGMLRFTEKVLQKVDVVSGSTVNLYFADPQWTRLVAEKASMANEPDKGKKIARLIELLARGPSGDAGSVLPRSAKARQVYLGSNGQAIIDLEPGLEEVKGQGTAAELMSVFSIVHTVTENVEGVTSVRLIVGGREVETFAGSVSVNEPLKPRADLAPAHN